jgi:hypothetical protein
MTLESNRAVFWTRLDYEDNAQDYLIWAVLMKRAGGTVNEALVRRAYAFLRQHETNGLYVPPPPPGAPSAKGWKTYHDVLEYDPDDCPASNQGFPCGALLAARELGLAVTKAELGRGLDPYAVLLAEAKRRGREALLTFRMHDDHGNDFLRTPFLVDHPDGRLGTEPYRGRGALDFGREEVRDYTFRLIEEAVRRYDSDGLELDFNRFPAFFKGGTTDERVSQMNSLVARIRAMLDQVGSERGRRLILAVRVPSNFGRTPPTPETARKIGCDVPAWVQRGWFDWVTVSEFLYERGDLPIAAWKRALLAVPIYGGIECTRGSGQKNLSADEYRRAARDLIHAGANGVYLFNFFTSREGGENAYEPPFEVLRDLGVPIALPQAAHPVPPWDVFPPPPAQSVVAHRASGLPRAPSIESGTP